MNLTSAQFPKRLAKAGARFCRLFTATLCFSVLTAVPALAEPVQINKVVQTLSSTTGTIDIKLSLLVTQDPGTSSKGGTQQNGPRSETQGQGGTKTDSIISGVTVTPGGTPIGVDIIEEGEVDGTICDCGEILVAGGFPKWPFLFLAAVPLAFIDTTEETPDSTPTPTPTPTPPTVPTPTPSPPGVPEPASLLLFGTGLAAAGAGLRRRYNRTKQNQEEE